MAFQPRELQTLDYEQILLVGIIWVIGVPPIKNTSQIITHNISFLTMKGLPSASAQFDCCHIRNSNSRVVFVLCCFVLGLCSEEGNRNLGMTGHSAQHLRVRFIFKDFRPIFILAP